MSAVDHVGYLVRDLDAGIELARAAFGVEVVRPVDRPQWSLLGVYMGEEAEIEVFTFTDAALLAERLGGADLVVDHVARAVDDIAAEMAVLRERGIRFSGPDMREDVDEPFDLGGALHIWTRGALGLQLIERR